MRIISGKYKGKIITAPAALPVRPTTDFAKTALFNILNNNFDLTSVDVLDLFSGTGNITYEFISRGCKSTISIDTERLCIKFIESLISKIGCENNYAVKSDALVWLQQCNQTFDIIFADPPFEKTPFEELVKIVFDNTLLKKNGWLIIEHSSKNELPVKNYLKETRIYGAVAFSIFVQQ